MQYNKEERIAYWKNVLLDNIVTQGVLQKRKNNTWRLRWREYKEDGSIIHRSLVVPEREVAYVRAKLDSLRELWLELRESKQHSREEYRQYRKFRKLLKEDLSGSRRRIIAAQRKYDSICQTTNFSFEKAYMLAITGSIPKQRGRPPTPQNEKDI